MSYVTSVIPILDARVDEQADHIIVNDHRLKLTNLRSTHLKLVKEIKDYAYYLIQLDNVKEAEAFIIKGLGAYAMVWYDEHKCTTYFFRKVQKYIAKLSVPKQLFNKEITGSMCRRSTYNDIPSQLQYNRHCWDMINKAVLYECCCKTHTPAPLEYRRALHQQEVYEQELCNWYLTPTTRILFKYDFDNRYPTHFKFTEEDADYPHLKEQDGRLPRDWLRYGIGVKKR